MDDSKPMECVHGNTSMFTLEYHIQKLELMISISVFPFWLQWRIYHSRQIHCIYKQWEIQSEDVSRCTGGKSYKHPNLPHTTNYISTRLFRPCILRCMRGKKIGLQSWGWRGHNHRVHCNGLKKSHDLCFVDNEYFTRFNSTNKGSKSYCSETMQDVYTYKNTVSIFYQTSTVSDLKTFIHWVYLWSNGGCRGQYHGSTSKVDVLGFFHHSSPHYEEHCWVHWVKPGNG